ncbi:succinylglutamate desuccinylase/aspartoacylase family protein [Algivirga pacifica]|uniref:Succinylglutamate desuccinylase/Aspartoacylase catalytic domain-containing protein n=1 Tax=Algivirga pacifica TaxID=1162670 RepID=A0ABP9DG03_9BACT
MEWIYSHAFQQSLPAKRIIGEVGDPTQGPALLFFGGIHGNELSGLFALQQVFKQLESQAISFNGYAVGITGNLAAIRKTKRFEDEDLNRIWTKEKIEQLNSPTYQPISEEEKEQKEIYEVIQEVLQNNPGPFYFFDLHTTSSDTIPFITVNDNLLNRSFTQHYPVPIILGIEEYLEGPLLSYINRLGYVAFGYEGGQHTSEIALDNHIAFIYLSIILTGSITNKEFFSSTYYQHLLKQTASFAGFYEITHRHALLPTDLFQMQEGFVNFERIRKNTPLALHNQRKVTAPKSGYLFMPLYQPQGEDGFFVIQKINPFFLRLSAKLRKWKLDQWIVQLPGIEWDQKDPETLIVHQKTAHFLTKKIFHLLGYRRRKVNQNTLHIHNREKRARYGDYEGASWLNI